MKSSLIRRAALLLAIACLAAPVARNAAASSSRPPAPGPTTRAGEMDDDEYAVISAVINIWRGPEKSGGVLVIKDKTEAWEAVGAEGRPDAFYEEMKKSSKELLDETIADFRARNKEPQRLQPRFDVKLKYVLVSAEEIEGFFKDEGGTTDRVMDGWKAFYEKYPNSGGFFGVSRVGFNSDKTQALVYQMHGCGGLCGEGSYILFKKKNGAWVEEGTVGPAWAS